MQLHDSNLAVAGVSLAQPNLPHLDARETVRSLVKDVLSHSLLDSSYDGYSDHGDGNASTSA